MVPAALLAQPSMPRVRMAMRHLFCDIHHQPFVKEKFPCVFNPSQTSQQVSLPGKMLEVSLSTSGSVWPCVKMWLQHMSTGWIREREQPGLGAAGVPGSGNEQQELPFHGGRQEGSGKLSSSCCRPFSSHSSTEHSTPRSPLLHGAANSFQMKGVYLAY